MPSSTARAPALSRAPEDNDLPWVSVLPCEDQAPDCSPHEALVKNTNAHICRARTEQGDPGKQ